MGGNTLLSFPGSKPLKDRTNIVLTDVYTRDDCVVVPTLEKLKEELRKYPEDEVFVVGGAMFYRTMIDYCSEAFVTKVDDVGGAEVFFPNLDEAEELLGKKIGSASDAAKMLAEKFGTSVLLKGGHIPGNKIVDILAHAGGGIKKFESPRIKNLNTHGSGCTLSAAITANMASGKSLEESCSQAKLYLEKIMKNPVNIAGELFMNRFIKP